MKPSASLIALIVGTILFSCSDKGTEFPLSIENSSWKLQRIEMSGTPTVVIPPSETYTVAFRTSNEVGGIIHCNTYEAKYFLAADGAISFGDINATKMGCPRPTHAGEFQRALAESKSMQLLRDEMRLFNFEHTRILYFVRMQ